MVELDQAHRGGVVSREVSFHGVVVPVVAESDHDDPLVLAIDDGRVAEPRDEHVSVKHADLRSLSALTGVPGCGTRGYPRDTRGEDAWCRGLRRLP